MSNNGFKTGDVVKLKSGGPDMSVKSENGKHLTCQWFAGKKLEQGIFHIDTLEHAVQAVQ
ncbi:YodC family protein [Pseudomonas sp. SC3(2021)]|uniref:YodC family protein n=1 Tax=Pseudomonas sp. SC3(2021) TaxID=2871493 RepID=UPI001C9E0763|nr:DUF2158 domain-containing protein [Pseudomonas sp. SC3(2021)]